MTEPYDVILADPPWTYTKYSKQKSRTADAHYPVMSLEEICNLPVNTLTGKNCALFLWATYPTIADYAFKVIESWGFRYVTFAAVWTKLNKSPLTLKQASKEWDNRPVIHYNDSFYTTRMGMGSYTRGNSEPLLLALKGRMPVPNRGVRQELFAPYRGHSTKPYEQYGLIEQMYPGMRKIELFARQEVAGWDVWGNEVLGDVELVESGSTRCFDQIRPVAPSPPAHGT